MSVNLTALLERVAALEARDEDSLVTVEDCGPNGFPDHGENATSPEGLNICVMVYSTVWFWLGASCILGPLLLPVALCVLEFVWALVWSILRGCLCCGWFDFLFRKLFGTKRFTWFLEATALNEVHGVWSFRLASFVGGFIFSDNFSGMGTILFCFGPSVLLLGGYQRDYNVAGYVLVGLSLLLLVCCLLDTSFSSFKAIRKAAKAKATEKAKEAVKVTADAKAVVAVKAKAVPKATEKMDVDTEWKADNVYSDLETPFLLVLVYGAAQIMLVGFYIYSLYTNGRPDFTNTDTYIFYFAGCLFQIILFSKDARALGGAAPKILSSARNRTLFKNDELVVVAEWNIFFRQVLDIAINVCAAPVIYFSLPLQLAGTSTNYFDFLLNSCATVFILELDDTEGCTYILKSAAAAAVAVAAYAAAAAATKESLAQAQEPRTTTAAKVSDQESAAKCERSASDSMASSSTRTPAPRGVLL